MVEMGIRLNVIRQEGIRVGKNGYLIVGMKFGALMELGEIGKPSGAASTLESRTFQG